MVTEEREVEDYKIQFAKKKKFYESWDVEDFSNITLLDVIKNFKVTVLIGTSGQSGHFTEDIIKAMAENIQRPLIFPLSNPTSKIEAAPQEIYKLTNGKAIVATGSPFRHFSYEGKEIVIGQGNNM